MRRIGWSVPLVMVMLLALWPEMAGAQRARRWVADPQLIAEIRTIGPNGGLQTFAGIGDIDLLDAQTGWAITGQGFMRWDGRNWRLVQRVSSRESFTALDLVSPTDGWVVGYTITYNGSDPPYATPSTLRYNGENWANFATPFQIGGLTDIAGLPGGTAWAIGYAQQNYTVPQQPIVSFFDGTNWQNRTPPQWKFGNPTAVQVLSANDVWVAGQLKDQPDPNLTSPGRPALFHFLNGTWTEVSLPQLSPDRAFQFDQLLMRDATEGWATLREIGPCAVGAVVHYVNGSWTRIDPRWHNVAPVTLGLIPGTNRGWATLYDECRDSGVRFASKRVRFDNGEFLYDVEGGTEILPGRYALLNDQIQLAAGGSAFMRFTDEKLPTERLAGGLVGGGRYFDVTGHYVNGPFLQYYQTHGLNLGDPGTSDRESLALFGYPLSEAFQETNPDTGQVLLVQYFERARFELHPENPDPYKVLLGRLGFATLIRNNRGTVNRSPELGTPAPPNCDRFPETGYTLCEPFRAYWNRNGALGVFGFSLTDARDEQSRTDGRTYQTQYFERERMEYHPENRGTPYEVLLGLLAAEDLRLRGYLQ